MGINYEAVIRGVMLKLLVHYHPRLTRPLHHATPAHHLSLTAPSHPTSTIPLHPTQPPPISQVSKWTKGVDIFSKHFLLIPINSALHWSLAIVCFPGHAKLTGPRPQGGSGAGEGAGGASGGAGAGSGAGGGANVGAGADVVLEVDDDGDGDGGGSDGILAANGPSPSASPNHRVSSLSWFRDPSHASQCPMVLTLDSLGETHKGLSIHSAGEG